MKKCLITALTLPTVYVLVTDNKFDFYNITEIADKKYKVLDRALQTYYSTKDVHDTSISTNFSR